MKMEGYISIFTDTMIENTEKEIEYGISLYGPIEMKWKYL